jgi:Tol biopolymer transport system component
VARRELLVLLAACTGTPRIASDAEIVFAAGQDLAVMNLDGSAREQLTHDPELEFLPHFSPDATRVVYTKFLQGSYGTPDARTDIALYDFTTRTETLLTARGDAAQAAWSPDGTTLAFLAHSVAGSELWLMDADGAHPRVVLQTAEVIGDPAWSSDDWILLVVAEQPAGPCFKTRLDKLRPDGSDRTQVSDGGASCTPAGMEQSGDADPGFSADGRTIYTSRGLPRSPAGGSPPLTERKLVALSSEPWTPGKQEIDLSLPSQPDCIEGVPKGSPDGTRILLFRACFDVPIPFGVYLTDTQGSQRTFIADGFGPDWNPTR